MKPKNAWLKDEDFLNAGMFLENPLLKPNPKAVIRLRDICYTTSTATCTTATAGNWITVTFTSADFGKTGF